MPTSFHIPNIQDARAQKKMGIPLNTAPSKPSFSLAHSKHWVGLMNAHANFVTAIQEYSQAGGRARKEKWKLVRRRLGEISEAMLRWREVLNMVDEGTKLKLNLDDLPIWLDYEVPHVTEMRGQNAL